jgi:uncharacterized membrane protein YphA (DoxX/SURF4 family)
MNQKKVDVFQLLLRIAISFSFLSAVADRFGLWGNPGDVNVSWGNWDNFIAYSNSVNSFASPQISSGLAIIATVLEVLLSLLLLLGYKTRQAATASGVLLLGFGLAMTFSFGIKPSLDYSVWTAAAGSFLLSAVSTYRYSIDHGI